MITLTYMTDEFHPAMRILVDEHRVILRVVARLEDAVDGDVDAIDPDFLRDCVHFFRDYADARHHGKEEAILFARLRAGPLAGDDGLLAEMEEEHVTARDTVNRLEYAIEDFAEDAPDAIAALADVVADLSQIYRDHIEKEDQVLFPDLQTLMSADALTDLQADFEQTDAATPTTLKEMFPRLV